MEKSDKYTLENIDEILIKYTTEQYQLLLILINCFEIFKLRELDEPEFKHDPKSNLYSFFGKLLQIHYHKEKDL